MSRPSVFEAMGMPLELPLWMQPTPAHNGTPTSREAAHAIKPHALTLRNRVLLFVSAAADGATAEEIERGLSLAGNTVRPRLVELRETACIRDSGRTRKTASGRAAVVWEIVK